jgi:hypothetical protein
VVRFGQHLPDSGRHFAQLCGRAMTQPEPVLRELMIGELGDAIHRFKSAFSRALPRLPREELLWRIQFMVGAMAHTMATLELIDEIHQGFLDTRDVEGIVDRMTRFVVAGLQAPMTEDSE